MSFLWRRGFMEINHLRCNKNWEKFTKRNWPIWLSLRGHDSLLNDTVHAKICSSARLSSSFPETESSVSAPRRELCISFPAGFTSPSCSRARTLGPAPMQRRIAYMREVSMQRGHTEQAYLLYKSVIYSRHRRRSTRLFFRFFDHLIKQELLICSWEPLSFHAKIRTSTPRELARVSHLNPIGTAV